MCSTQGNWWKYWKIYMLLIKKMNVLFSSQVNILFFFQDCPKTTKALIMTKSFDKKSHCLVRDIFRIFYAPQIICLGHIVEVYPSVCPSIQLSVCSSICLSVNIKCAFHFTSLQDTAFVFVMHIDAYVTLILCL